MENENSGVWTCSTPTVKPEQALAELEKRVETKVRLIAELDAYLAAVRASDCSWKLGA